MSEHLDAEVIVVGGGPAGASTACALARDGVDVLVLDRASFPRDKVCAEYLSPQASRVLFDMGVLDQIEASGPAHLRGMRVSAPNGAIADGEFASSHGFRGFRDKGLAIRRTILDEIVLRGAQAAGARVEESTRVTDLNRHATGRISGVDVIDRDGRTRSLRARYVVGADGLRSVVGRRLGLVKTSRIWPRRIALVAHYRNVDRVSDIGEMHVDYDGYFGLVDVGGGKVNVAVVIPQSRAQELGEDKTKFFERWISSRPHLAERFAAAERITPVRATGPFATISRRPWSPGAALVGDAADFFDPFTGEGIYSALRGGELLAPYLVEALGRGVRDEKLVLSGYDRARKREFGGKWKLERIVGMAIAYPWFLNNAATVLSRRKDLADLIVGVAGDFIPARLVLSPRFLFTIFISPAFRS
ncbi:MAG TPA: NAD(P)/FAD-dependent oxidoreductase [Gemmatimonadaceae bacterium]|nr:NAD(P)/FAD-dependent oxidoreductase [Gemmatimonadaceae bacterium]